MCFHGVIVEALLEAVPKQTFPVTVPVSDDDPPEHNLCCGPDYERKIQGQRKKTILVDDSEHPA